MHSRISPGLCRLADAGIPLGAQTVLLKGVNDSVPVMKELIHKLLLMRVRPYYLYQCDPISGSAHFRTTIEKGLEIIGGLRGHTTGYGVPTYVVDAPGGGGKIPLQPNYYVGREGDDVLPPQLRGQDVSVSRSDRCLIVTDQTVGRGVNSPGLFMRGQPFQKRGDIRFKARIELQRVGGLRELDQTFVRRGQCLKPPPNRRRIDNAVATCQRQECRAVYSGTGGL